MNSVIYGPYPSRSNGGRRFTQKPSSYWCGPITKIDIYGNDNTINGLQITYQHFTPQIIGSATGETQSLEIEAPNRISSVAVGFDSTGVVYLKFTLSNNNSIQLGNSSVHHQEEISIPENKQLLYFMGRKGDAIDLLSYAVGDIIPQVDLQASSGPYPANTSNSKTTNSTTDQSFTQTNLKSINVYYTEYNNIAWITGIEMTYSGEFTYSVGVTEGDHISSKSYQLKENDAISEVYIQWADNAHYIQFIRFWTLDGDSFSTLNELTENFKDETFIAESSNEIMVGLSVTSIQLDNYNGISGIGVYFSHSNISNIVLKDMTPLGAPNIVQSPGSIDSFVGQTIENNTEVDQQVQTRITATQSASATLTTHFSFGVGFTVKIEKEFGVEGFKKKASAELSTNFEFGTSNSSTAEFTNSQTFVVNMNVPAGKKYQAKAEIQKGQMTLDWQATAEITYSTGRVENRIVTGTYESDLAYSTDIVYEEVT